MRACEKCHVQIVSVLLEAGAIPDLKNKFGNTAMMIASGRGHVEIVRLLLENSAETDLRHVRGDTALICACDRAMLRSDACCWKLGLIRT